eukprot:IDg13417t1
MIAEYNPSNVYNAEEIRLFYSIIPSRTYLFQSEDRLKIRETSLMRSKWRIPIIFCTNSDESHKNPLLYIGSQCTKETSSRQRIDIDHSFFEEQSLQYRILEQKKKWEKHHGLFEEAAPVLMMVDLPMWPMIYGS